MFNLMRNENMKIYRRGRTWVMVGLLLAIVVFMGIVIKNFELPEVGDWRANLEKEITSMEKMINDPERGLPEEQKTRMQANVKVLQYYLDNDINPNEYSGWKFSEDSSELIVLVTIFTAIVAGDIVASEFTWGTIKLLLIRPVNRTKILIAKYLSTLIFALLLLVVLFVWSYVMGGIIFGFDSLDMPYVYADQNSVVHEMSMVTYVLQTYGYKVIDLLMIVTISFMISASFRSSSFAIGLSLFVLFMGSTIGVQLVQHYEWAKYLLFNNTNLTQYLLNQPLHPSMTLGFSIAVLVVHFVVFHLVAWWMFVKRDVAA